MEQYNVIFLQSALEDVEEIVLYIAADSKKEAMKMHDMLVKKANDLAIFPKRGMPVPDKKIADMGFRMLIIGKYIMFYRIDSDTVHIHRILHGGGNYPILFGGPT